MDNRASALMEELLLDVHHLSHGPSQAVGVSARFDVPRDFETFEVKHGDNIIGATGDEGA